MEQTYSHDSQYKKVFSNHIFVEKLLTSFVHEEFVKDLDFTRMTKKNNSYVSDDMKNYESDIVYEIYYRDKPVYIYLLMEFQSTPDNNMPMRFLRYILELYRDNDVNTDSKQYPAIFPLLLYNGERTWTAKSNISEIIEPSILGKYIPNFEYFPILINEIDKKELLGIHNAVSALFYMENIETSEYHDAIDKLVELIRGSTIVETKIFARWLNNLFSRSGKGLTEVEFNKIKTPEEALPMIEAKIERYGKELLQKGLEQGIEQGKSAGRREIAFTLLKEGSELEFVSKVTGFTIRELKTFTSNSI